MGSRPIEKHLECVGGPKDGQVKAVPADTRILRFRTRHQPSTVLNALPDTVGPWPTERIDEYHLVRRDRWTEQLIHTAVLAAEGIR